MEHIAWPNIQNFHSVRRYMKDIGGAAEYRSKIKLHGSNGGIQTLSSGEVGAMSRETMVTPEKDNAGFAKFVKAREAEFSRLRRRGYTTIVYGEWCGKGIQRGVAVSSLDSKIFAVFAARLIPNAEGLEEEFITGPVELSALVSGIPDIYVLPWHSSVPIDWSKSSEELTPVIDGINKDVLEVEACDPWIKATFGIDGVGEGLVFYPMTGKYEDFVQSAFKAKGEKHQVVAHTKPAQVDATATASAEAFAELVVTEARCEQGAQASGTLDMKNIGRFLKWLTADLQKETSAEREAYAGDKKLADKACAERARSWYKSKVQSS